jgi:hypothetical protein
MKQMQFRDLTSAESFPLAYGQDLLKKQSEHFVNKIISYGNFESGYVNMPVNFPQTLDNIPLIVNTKPPQFFIITYLKNNWKPMLVFGAVIAVSVTVYHLLKQKKEKKSNETKIPKTIYYNLPKKSI